MSRDAAEAETVHAADAANPVDAEAVYWRRLADELRAEVATFAGVAGAGFFFQPRRPYALAIMTGYGAEREAAERWLRATASRIAAAIAMLDAVFDGRAYPLGVSA